MTACSVHVQPRGWTLIDDPSLLVEHFCAERAHEDPRLIFDGAAFHNPSFNLLLITRE